MFIAHEIPKRLKAPEGRHVYSVKYLAPAGRHVYSTRDTQIVLKPQRGGMFIEFESLKYLAPAGRHVYSTRDTQKS